MKGSDYLVYGVLLLVIFGGGYFFFLGLRNVWRGIASASWPRTTGTVVQSNTQKNVTYDKEKKKDDVMYEANIAFEYHVGGHDYTTSILHFGQTLGSGSPADAELRHIRYPEGSDVPIAYNPSHPEIAAAEPGFNLEALWLIVAGLAFILPCVMAGAIVYSSDLNDATASPGMAIGVGVFGCIFAALGIAALCAGLINLSRAKNSEHWPKAPGVIRFAKLERSEPDQGQSASYTANLVYEYEVAGRKYYGKVRRFGVLNGDIQQEASAAERYPVGTEVTVSYSPVNPNVAALEPGVQGATYALAGVGAGCLFFASLVFIFIVPSVLHS